MNTSSSLEWQCGSDDSIPGRDRGVLESRGLRAHRAPEVAAQGTDVAAAEVVRVHVLEVDDGSRPVGLGVGHFERPGGSLAVPRMARRCRAAPTTRRSTSPRARQRSGLRPGALTERRASAGRRRRR